MDINISPQLSALKFAGATRSRSFKQLLSVWSNLIQEIEGGYDRNIFEYTNDLSARDALETLIHGLDGSLREEADTVITTLDERYRATTIEREGLLKHRYGRGWWWSRVPTKAGQEFQEGLRIEERVRE